MKEKILKFITGYIKQHGYPPSRREIGEGVGLRSTSSVQSHIVGMLKTGMLESDDEYATPRALRVPGMKFVQAGKTNYEKYAGTKEKFADFIMFIYTHNDEWEQMLTSLICRGGCKKSPEDDVDCTSKSLKACVMKWLSEEEEHEV